MSTLERAFRRAGGAAAITLSILISDPAPGSHGWHWIATGLLAGIAAAIFIR